MKYLGKEVRIRFLDHSMSPKHCAGPVVCKVRGIISREEKNFFEVTSWEVEQDEDGAAMNDECFTIVKGAIISFEECTKFVKRTIPGMLKLTDADQYT